jgi:hypothetical protein
MKKNLQLNSQLIMVLLVMLILSAGRAMGDVVTAMPGIEMKAYPAIGNFHKYKKTLPICVELTNMGPHFSGSIEVNKSVPYRHKKEIIYRNIQLPASSSKQFFLYLPDFEVYNPRVEVQLKTRNQVVNSSTISVDHIYIKDFLILAFSKEQAGFEYLTNPKLKPIFGKDAQISLAYPDLARLPPNWAGFDSADFALLCNFPSLSMSREAQIALRDWVLSGGTLFVSASLSPTEFAGSPLEEILPVKIGDTLQIDSLDSMEAYCGAAPSPGKGPLIIDRVENRGGTVCLAEKGHPLIIRKNCGRGTVYFCSFDITKPPFTIWQGNNELWTRLFGDIVVAGKGADLANDATPLSTMPELATPSLVKLSFFLFIYILIVGPINYLILKKKDRMLYTFLTVPVIALLFTFASFLYGYSTKGSSVLFRTISICEVEKHCAEAPVTSYCSLFSPGMARYEIEIKNPQSIAWELNPSDNKDFIIEWGNSLCLKELSLDMWSMRRFKAREIVTFPGALDLDVRSEGGKLLGTVNNGTGIKLNNCVLIHNCRVSPPFTLNSGKNSIQADLSAPLENPMQMASHFLKIYSTGAQDPHLDVKKEQMSFLLYFSTMYFARGDRMAPTIIGVTDKQVSCIRLARNVFKGQNSSFFIMR